MKEDLDVMAEGQYQVFAKEKAQVSKLRLTAMSRWRGTAWSFATGHS